MKKILLVAFALLCVQLTAFAQIQKMKTNGTCGVGVNWEYNAGTLTIKAQDIKSEGIIADYSRTSKAPWVKKKLDIKKLVISTGVTRIGSCAFANCTTIQNVVFESRDLVEIGWGAFMKCSRLHNLSIPNSVKKIETVAFANCSSVNSVRIPDGCHVESQAFLNCTNLETLDVSPSVSLGNYVFANEIEINNRTYHKLYAKEIRRLPAYINSANCNEYGIAREAFERIKKDNANNAIDYDIATAHVDTIIPEGNQKRFDTYALVIGNQNYRFVTDVPYAIHDARVFKTYCEKALGIPTENIHICEDATKAMIMEEEFDWIRNIEKKNNKKLIVYYAGHGVPDKDKDKSYLLPTDVRGTTPWRGIPLDEFYDRLGKMNFKQTSVFLDACFSGVNRNNDGIVAGLRATEIDAPETELASGNVVVFSACQGNETAQAYPQTGHGLFTYYLLETMNRLGDTITFGELSDNIEKNVSTTAPSLKLRKKQTPTTKPSENAKNWKRMSF